MEINFMNEIKNLCAMEPYQLEPANIAFLRARRSYLTTEQFEKVKGICLLEVSTQPQDPETVLGGEEPKPKSKGGRPAKAKAITKE